MSLYVSWGTQGYAANVFDIRQGAHYNIPKPSFLYFVEFNVNNTGKRYLSDSLIERRLGFIVKSLDRPSISYDTVVMNQYNRKRLIHTGVNYGNLSMTMHDTVDDAAFKLIQDYNVYYFGDFARNASDWQYNLYQGDSTSEWGYRMRNGAGDIHFFSSADVYEFYNGYYTHYKLMNPRFESVNPSRMASDASDINEISMSLRHEGMVFEALSQRMTSDVSSILGLPFESGSTRNFRLAPDERVPRGELPIQQGGFSAGGFNIGGELGLVGQNVLSSIQASGMAFLRDAATNIIARPVQSAVGSITSGVASGVSNVTSGISSGFRNAGSSGSGFF